MTVTTAPGVTTVALTAREAYAGAIASWHAGDRAWAGRCARLYLQCGDAGRMPWKWAANVLEIIKATEGEGE